MRRESTDPPRFLVTDDDGLRAGCLLFLGVFIGLFLALWPK